LNIVTPRATESVALVFLESELVELSGGVFTVGSALYKQHSFYIGMMNTVGFVTEWIQIVALPILLIFTLSLIRMRREKQ
jgi:hypothetical protein